MEFLKPGLRVRGRDYLVRDAKIMEKVESSAMRCNQTWFYVIT